MCKQVVGGDGLDCVLCLLLLSSKKDRTMLCSLPDKQSQIKEGAYCVRGLWVVHMPCLFHICNLMLRSARYNRAYSIHKDSTQPAFLHSCLWLLPFVHIFKLTCLLKVMLLPCRCWRCVYVPVLSYVIDEHCFRLPFLVQFLLPSN